MGPVRGFLVSVFLLVSLTWAAGTTAGVLLSAPQGPLRLGDGTAVKVRLTQALSSATAQTNDRVNFEVVEEVKVANLIVIPKGSAASGTVTNAEAKRRMGRGGKLDVNIESVRLANGDKAALRGVKDAKGSGHTGAMAGGMVATSLVMFPAAPLFLLMHGKDVTIPTVRGREPGDYAMVAFGGAGGLFATEVADFLGIGTVISPPEPGNVCAFGLHVCDVARDYIRTLVRRESAADVEEIGAAWRELERTGRADIEAEGIPGEAIAIRLVADVRYFGEGHEVHVEIPLGMLDKAAIDFMWDEFHNVHDRTFGFNYRGQQDVELVNLRVRAVGTQSRPQIKPVQNRHEPAAPFGQRKVYWRSTGWIDVPLFRRSELALDQRIAGPAIIEEYGSTIVMPPLWSLHSDRYRNLILARGR